LEVKKPAESGFLRLTSNAVLLLLFNTNSRVGSDTVCVSALLSLTLPPPEPKSENQTAEMLVSDHLKEEPWSDPQKLPNVGVRPSKRRTVV
jgi:hypothetical protein